MIFNSVEQIRAVKGEIVRNLRRGKIALEELLDAEDAFEAFASVKFKRVGFDPINGEPLNFIEMVNQAFSDLVVLHGVKELICKYPGQSFTVRMGTASGYDIESLNGRIVGECFAITKMRSNGKLKADTEKLLFLDEKVHKYIFFYSEEDTDEAITRFTSKYPEITYIRVKKSDIS